MSETPNYTLISPKQFKERVCASLDTPLGINTIYRLVKQKDFPSLKIGNQYYIIESEVAEWLRKQTNRRKNTAL